MSICPKSFFFRAKIQFFVLSPKILIFVLGPVKVDMRLTKTKITPGSICLVGMILIVGIGGTLWMLMGPEDWQHTVPIVTPTTIIEIQTG